MNLLVLVIAVAFVSAVIWLARNWNAKGPTDLWNDDDISSSSTKGPSRLESRPDPHVEQPVVAIGYWGDASDPGLPNPDPFVDASWAPDERDMVISFLDEGRPVGWMATPATACAFCDELSGPGDRTDGVYVWPAGLSHTLESHQVRLPGVFVLHVRTAKADRARQPDLDLSWLDQHPAPAIDDSWWRAIREP